MKKTYERPEIEITSFSTEDIITASATGMNTVDDVIGAAQKIDISDENKWTK
ncbi:MAG: hypothetical protein ACI4WS_04175 [Oscillospiraceae bacterium]